MPNYDEFEITFGDDGSGESLPDITMPLFDDGSEPIRATALHEAGHVIAIHRYGVPIRSVTIRAHVSDDEFGAVPGQTEVDPAHFSKLTLPQRAACGLAGLYVEYLESGSKGDAGWTEWVCNRPAGRGDDDERKVRDFALAAGTDYRQLAAMAWAILVQLQPPVLEVARDLVGFLLERQEDTSFTRAGKDIEDWLASRLKAGASL